MNSNSNPSPSSVLTRPASVPTPSPTDSMSDTYISSLSPKEYKAYLIAKSHLEMSFDVEKSIGFKQFMARG
jgi:hypothetical protein